MARSACGFSSKMAKADSSIDIGFLSIRVRKLNSASERIRTVLAGGGLPLARGLQRRLGVTFHGIGLNVDDAFRQLGQLLVRRPLLVECFLEQVRRVFASE